MSDWTLNHGQTLLAGLVLVAVLLLAEGLRLLWLSRRGRGARRLAQRLSQLQAETQRARAAVLRDRAGNSDTPGIAQRILGPQRWQRLTRWTEQAGMTESTSRLLALSAMGGLGLAAVSAAIAGPRPLVWAGTALAGALVPWAVVAVKRRRRLARIARQLPDAIDFIVRALRSGHAFTSALSMCGDETAEPLAAELRLTHDEISYGASLQRALQHLGERVPLADLRYLCVAVLVQRESGGNLTEILDKLSQLIRSRYRLRAKVKVLSADARMSAAILMVAPFALGALMNMVNPAFMSRLWTDPIGIAILQVLGVLMVVGFFILQKITRIRV